MAAFTIYSDAIEAALGEIETLLLIDRPEIPADIPIANPPAAFSIIKALIDGGIDPVLEDFEQNMDIINESISEWQKFIGNVRVVDRQARSTEFSDFKTRVTYDVHIRNARARIRNWKQHKANLEVRLTALQIAIPAAVPVPAAVAVPAPIHMPLPPIDIPKFFGDRTKYQSFIQLFRALIDASPRPSIYKLGCLLSLLRGDASSLVQGFECTDANYPQVLAILESAYGDTEDIARELRSKLQNLPAATDNASLKKLHHESEAIIRQLISLRRNVASDETILLIEQKIDDRHLEKLFDKRKLVESRMPPNNIWQLDTFRTALSEIVSEEEKLASLKAHNNQNFSGQTSLVDSSKNLKHTKNSFNHNKQNSHGHGKPSLNFMAIGQSRPNFD
jgi:hypothetical protein